MQEAIDSGDYDSWVAIRVENDLPMRGRIFSVINEDNFNLFKELRDATLNGDYDRAQEIREELGLGLRNGDGEGRGQGRGHGRGHGRVNYE